jgi:hypothetical protein
VGSGVQPDTTAVTTAAEGVPGDGAESLAEVLKQLEALRQEQAKVAEALREKDEKVAGLEAELAKSRKTRVAPSAPPEDGEGGRVEKAAVAWPRDMNDWKPE